MAPKKKTITVIGSSGAERPVPVRAGDVVVVDGSRGVAREHPRRSSSRSPASGVVRAQDNEPHATQSKDGAGPPQAARGPPRVASCQIRAARRLLRCPRRSLQRAPPRLCATNSATTLVTQGAALGSVTCTLHMTRRGSMRAEVLTEMADGRRAMMELLLT